VVGLRICCAAALASACGGGSGSTDAATDGVPNDGRYHIDDGTPTRQQCTSSFGGGLSATATFGRLDGVLVAIVPPGGGPCNADSSHVHLQVRMSGAVYDVAIDVTDGMTGVDDVHSATFDIAMPVNTPWVEGWHTALNADYVAVGVHSTDLPLQTKAALTSALMTDLATANHVSIYATTYGADGAHLVHRNGNGKDGFIVTQPLSNPSHLRLFSFSSQTF
jgi:hypothetical protein